MKLSIWVLLRPITNQLYDLNGKIIFMPIFKPPGARLRLHGKPRRRSWGTSTTTMEERCSSKLTKLALIVIVILIVVILSIVIIIITVKLSEQCTLERCNRQSRVTFISANLCNDLIAYCWPNAVITYPVTSIKESHRKRKWKFHFCRKGWKFVYCQTFPLPGGISHWPQSCRYVHCTAPVWPLFYFETSLWAGL